MAAAARVSAKRVAAETCVVLWISADMR
jgi:hypothetical protein